MNNVERWTTTLDQLCTLIWKMIVLGCGITIMLCFVMILGCCVMGLFGKL